MNIDYSLYRHAAELCPQKNPQLWKLCFPRRYVPPHGYANPSLLAASLYTELDWFSEVGREGYNKTMVDCTMVAWKLVELGVPTFFVAHDFIRDLCLSDPVEDMIMDELNWPYDAMAFMLPEKFQQSYFGRPVPYITMARVPSGINDPPACVSKLVPVMPMGIHDPGHFAYVFSATVLFGPKGVDYAGSWPTDKRIGDIMKEPQFTDSTEDNRSGYIEPSEMPTHEEDVDICNKIFAASLFMLMAMNAEPEHVEHSQLVRPHKVKGGKEKSELWSPNFFGRKYNSSQYFGGTHDSPRAHPRRGHWTHQPYGKGRALRKYIWLKHMLVNAGAKA